MSSNVGITKREVNLLCTIGSSCMYLVFHGSDIFLDPALYTEREEGPTMIDDRYLLHGSQYLH